VDPLPIDQYVPSIAAALERRRAVVVVADPGAGKTTRVPPALVDAGPVLLLQPRRAAARAIANRIATERGWAIGREVGWQIRFEHGFTRETRLLVATEGILTARLQKDPLLSAFRTIVLDEFHERSVHADLGIALSKQAWHARDDLRIVVMSATIDADRVAAFLGDCPIVRVSGRTYPLEVHYAPNVTASEAVSALLNRSPGDVLCFLPGAFEIQNAVDDIRKRVQPAVEVLALYGALDSAEQDRALSPASAGTRRVIVSTNIAETSVTVPGVTAVVDSGLQKVARYDATRAIDSLATERITQDAADQRAGRAGRIGPGIVTRLWESHDRLRPHREPDIHRIDLSGTVLDIVEWGADPRTFDWFETPRPDAVESAMRLLERLDAMRDGTLTATGRQMHALPLHPRLARILVAGGGARTISQACAILAERLFLPPRSASTTSDLLSAIDDWNSLPGHIHQVAGEIGQMAHHAGFDTRVSISDEEFRRAILFGYPDRVAQRREPNSPRVRLSSGAGGRIGPASGVHTGDFLAAVDVQASTRASDSDSLVRVASMIEREWLTPTGTEVIHRIDESGAVRAVEVERYDALVLSERPAKIDDQTAARLLADAWLAHEPSAEEKRLLRRLRFMGDPADLAQMAHEAARGARALSEIRLHRALPASTVSKLDREAPDTLTVPSGRPVRLQYGSDGTVSASVKLQELFGLGETPRVGARREPVVLSLLAPNGRPVQVTRDLRSFWDRTYPEVRKELRGRYPKHPWPDDPLAAAPTRRAKQRPKR
jgi:ATP-dependent RNA helicase HrpB